MITASLLLLSFLECHTVDAEGFTVEQPLEHAQCDDGTYELTQKVPVSAACVMEVRYLRRCNTPVEVEYEADDPKTPEPVNDPAKSCELYTLEEGCL